MMMRLSGLSAARFFIKEEDKETYNSLANNEKALIDLIYFNQFQAFEIHHDLPNINVLVSFLPFSSQDVNFLQAIIPLIDKGQLKFNFYLNEFFIDAKDKTALAKCQKFKFPENKINESADFKSLLQEWCANHALYWLQKIALHLDTVRSETGLVRDIPDECLINLRWIYSHTKEADLADVLVEELLPVIILVNNLKQASHILGEHLIRIVRAKEREQGFLLQTFAAGNKTDAECMLTLLGEESYKLCDANKNTFLHLCGDDLELLELALSLNADLEARNSLDNTPLLEAMKWGFSKKAEFLLKKGANSHTKNDAGESFWTIPSSHCQSEKMNLFRKYGKDGLVIDYPAQIEPQNGYTCGLNAAAFCANYHKGRKSFLFSDLKKIVVHKNKGEAKNNSALITIAKNGQKTIVGELMSAEALAFVIEKTECLAKISQISDIASFLNVIKTALSKKNPIIVPFCLAQDSHFPTLDANIDTSRAHWATIIGLIGDTPETATCWVAQSGDYFEIKAADIFYSFFNMSEKTQQLFMYKVIGKWQKYTEPQSDLEIDPVLVPKKKIIPETSLKLFRRHLIEVAEPAANQVNGGTLPQLPDQKTEDETYTPRQ